MTGDARDTPGTARISVYQNGKMVKEAPIYKSPFYVGRSPDCDVFLQHSSISRRHAEISRVADDYNIEDLKSRNGTYVNGQRIERQLLRNGDVIVVGKFRLQFYRDAGAELPAPRPTVVRMEHVSKDYYLGKQTVTALKDISMMVEDRGFVALAGPSGSGKTTLLNLIGCIDTPTKGSIFVAGEEVSKKTPDQLADLRSRALGFIFQTFNLLPVLSAWENVEYPLLQHKALDKKERRERVRHYLDVVGLTPYVTHRPNELSGGQRQRVAIARALATRPRIILADEPTANLDHKTGAGILELMKDINRKENTTFVFCTHDPRVIEMADRVIALSDGELIH